jgi:N-acyl-D-aspartate/D-glutamate deacylase
MRVLIENGRIVDGTGAPSRTASLLVEDDTIAEVGDVTLPPDEVIDATGLCVAPGFIDMHSHGDFSLPTDPVSAAKVMQGVTTEVVCNCGIGLFPGNDRVDAMYEQVAPVIFGEPSAGTSKDLDAYGLRLAQAELGVNVACLVPHGNVRCAVMSAEERAPSATELDDMRALVDEAMSQGAFGMSSGLVYAPGAYAQTAELIELAKAVVPYDGIYATHMRDEGGRLLPSVEEALAIGEGSGARVQISHHKALGKPNWGRVKDSLALVDAARARGHEVHSDVYPYAAGSTVLGAIALPTWAYEGSHEDLIRRLRDPATRKRMAAATNEKLAGLIDLPWWLGWLPKTWIVPIVITKMSEVIVLSSVKHDHALEGRTLREVVTERGGRFYDAVFDLLAEEDAAIMCIAHAISEDDVETVMTHPASMIGSDGFPMREGKPHPRTYGTFPRVLGRYVREQGLLDLETAVHRMTGMTAAKLGLVDRGHIAVGQAADLVLFDPKTVSDRATYDDPKQFPAGIPHVFVNGAWAVRDGRHTGARAGRLLRKSQTA